MYQSRKMTLASSAISGHCYQVSKSDYTYRIKRRSTW